MQRTFLVLGLLLLAACDDPAPVGVDLVDAQSGEPFVLDVTSTSPTVAEIAETTGNATRILFGSVTDPDFGPLEAAGYLDFVSPGVFSTAFETEQLSDVALLLATDYVYGDSLADISVAVRQIQDAWPGSGTTADTTLRVGSLITESTQNKRTVTLEIPMPADWVARWDTTFRSTTFDDAFHGLEVTSASGSAIMGAAVLNSALRAVAGGDTTFFPAGRSLTRLLHSEGLPDSSQPLVFQDGRKRAVEFNFEVETGRFVLNRGIVRVTADTSLSLSVPAGFNRPSVEQLELDWISLDGTRTPIAASFRTGNRFDFESVQLGDSLGVLVTGGSGLDRLEVRVPDGANTLSVIRLPLIDARPRALLTVTPIQ
ncbi:MAG: DUF4270 family protein [Rhodothermales bacterium]|nr:DUF4270 family protein [Rhodothermales bacterium]MBO6779830.1 DUF4270 family protein [Rhodothermales bacterium]